MIGSFHNLASANAASSSHDLIELECKEDWFERCVSFSFLFFQHGGSASLPRYMCHPLSLVPRVLSTSFAARLPPFISSRFLLRRLSSFALPRLSLSVSSSHNANDPSSSSTHTRYPNRSAIITLLGTERVVVQISRKISNMREVIGGAADCAFLFFFLTCFRWFRGSLIGFFLVPSTRFQVGCFGCFFYLFRFVSCVHAFFGRFGYGGRGSFFLRIERRAFPVDMP